MTGARARAVIAISAVVVLGACGSSTSAKLPAGVSYQIIPVAKAGAPDAELYSQSGNIQPGPATVDLGASKQSAVVVWNAMPCQTHPHLTVSVEKKKVSVVIYRGGGVTANCGASLEPKAVRISLAQHLPRVMVVGVRD